MKARVAATVVLLLIAVALPVAAILQRGPPWGYRGHSAVVVETVGAVEVAGKEGAVPPQAAPGLFLDVGDELRVGRYSEAHLRLPAGELVLGDDARAALAAKGVQLHRGLLDVTLPPGTTPFEVELPTHNGKIVVRPGDAGGAFRFVSDGKSEVRVFVKSGSAEAAVANDAYAETGKVLVVDGSRAARVEEQGTFAPTATCDTRALAVSAPGATQVIALRELRYPELGKAFFDVREPKTSVPVFARDVAGRVWQQSVPCVAAPAPRR